MDERDKTSISELKKIALGTGCATSNTKTDAQYMLGMCYWNGEGIEMDKHQAIFFFQESADHGNISAQLKLGECYYYGDGVSPDYQEALKYFIRASEHSKAACIWVAKCYLTKKLYNPKEAFAAFQNSVKDRNQLYPEGYYYLGLCYFYGCGIEKDEEKAFYFFNRAGSLGHLGAQYYLVVCYRDGLGVVSNSDSAAYWSLKCFDKNHEKVVKESMDCLGITI